MSARGSTIASARKAKQRTQRGLTARYCVWDEAHGDYVYTDAWIRKLATELADRGKFLEVIGHDPVPLPDTQTELAPREDPREASADEPAAV
jgi:hypothetical protein